MQFDSTQSTYRKSDAEIGSRQLFLATILSSDPATFNVTLSPWGQSHRQVIQGIPMSQTMSQLLGFRDSVLPPVGATVLCFKHATNQCLILGIVPKPDQLSEKLSYPLRTIVGAGDGMNDEQNAQGYEKKSTKLMLFNMGRPTDVVEGEKVVSNDFGVMLGLFQQLAMLKGSDLAMVQAFMLDDLVRIVSHNFQHFTCLGETRVYHDGKRLFLEAGLTDSAQESYGSAAVTSSAATKPFTDEEKIELDDSKDFYKMENPLQQAIERMKVFVGTLGDFFNVMLTCPPNNETVRALDGAQVDEVGFDKGLFQCRIGKDGAVAVRSVAGITLEKTNWIRVPHRIRAAEDPEGDDEAKITYDTTKPFQFNSEYKYEGQPTLYFLQLRDYLAYLHEKLGYVKFKKHPKDFQVNDDYAAENKLGEMTKVDPFTEVHYETRTSGVTLLPNGGVALRDAWGSAIIMDGGNIYLQPAKDLVAQPMRNLVAKVGGFTSVASKNDIDLSTTDGGFRVKSDQAQYFYSDNSGIVLEANGEGLNDYYPPELDAVSHVCGVVMKAPQGIVASYSKDKLDRATNAHVVDNKYFWINSSDSLAAKSGITTILSSEGSMMITPKNSVNVYSANALFVGTRSTMVGLKDQVFGLTKLGPFVSGTVTGAIKGEDLQNIHDLTDKVPNVRETITNFRTDESFDGLNFMFLASSNYRLQPEDVIPQTLVQQEHTLDESVHSLANWEETEINDSFPYPGKDKKDTYVTYKLINLEVTEAEVHNKADSASEAAAILEPIDIFTKYPVKP